MANPQAANTLFDATRESYTTAFDAWAQAQARAIRLGRLWLDEVETTQQESRRVFDDFVARSRQAQEAWLSLTQDSLRNVSAFWRWPAFSAVEELNSRLDDLNQKVEARETIKVAK
ncbi:MAG TPA: hypothetical protein VHL09_04405 [Dehalococcoidia bacterium]|nr:hypothetical protein [Dehalococcoidia bacterium]